MSEVAAARSRLFDALVAAPNIPTTVPFGSWRVHRVTPPQIVAPSCYIDSAELGLESLGDSRFVVATFPVVVVCDGTIRPQVEALDDLLASMWDAASSVGEPTDTTPISLDVGGPHLRAHQMRVGIIITARTLCASLVSTGGTP